MNLYIAENIAQKYHLRSKLLPIKIGFIVVGKSLKSKILVTLELFQNGCVLFGTNNKQLFKSDQVSRQE